MNKLQEAEAARDKYISEHPHLATYQQEIDELLSKVKPHERLEVLALVMAGKLTELKEKLGELHGIITQTTM